MQNIEAQRVSSCSLFTNNLIYWSDLKSVQSVAQEIIPKIIAQVREAGPL